MSAPMLARPPRGRVLCLAPHADDELLGAGGTLCLHAEQGDPVAVVVSFDGRLGLPPGADPALRRREALAGGAHLGLVDYTFLDHPEGHEPTAAELEQAAAGLAALLVERRPDIVYAPWPGEEHVDHRAAARVAVLALAASGFRGAAFGYEVWTPLTPEHVVDVSAVFARKLAALREHASQLAHTDLVRIAREHGQRRGAPGYGEAFARLAFDLREVGAGAP
jgi:LmbE family N-acetylglucosaminyl deacetylase